MQATNLVRGVLIAAAILSTSACSTPPVIGDPARPLMPPGEGLIASSVVFTTAAPDGMRYRGFLFSFEYEPIDGQKNELYFGLNDQDPRHIAKTPRAPQETQPILFLYPAKPGKYRLKRTRIVAEGSYSFWPEHPREIEVVAGQVTYLGSTVIAYRASWRGLGVLTPTDILLTTRDDFKRDMDELKAVEKRLESVVVKNALTR